MIGFTSCKDDEIVIGPEPVVVEDSTSNLTINIDHMIGADAMKYNENIVLPSMEDVQISRLSYILGDFYLLSKDGSKVELDDQYALIEAHKGNVSFTLTDIPFGNYTSIGFSIGLDSATNHGNPSQYETTHPLSPINNSLHWSWTGGYIFTALEGKLVDNDETFIFHLAGAQNRIDFELETDITTSTTSTNNEATVTYDVREIFEGPNVYNISTDGASSHSTTSPVTVKLISNMADVFTDFRVME